MYADRIIDELNYFNDRRNQEARDVSEYPNKWVICDVCQGDGNTVNPGIDCGGLSAEDFYEDPDFTEDYMSGVYDVPCGHCGGSGKVQVVDMDRMNDEEREEYEAELEAEASDRALARAELMMGA